MARRVGDRGPVREFLMFSLTGELYGVELTRIKEILSPPPITMVPRAPREVIGLLVDEVRHVVRLAATEIEPAATALGGDVSEFVLGIGRPAGEFLILLDLLSIVSG